MFKSNLEWAALRMGSPSTGEQSSLERTSWCPTEALNKKEEVGKTAAFSCFKVEGPYHLFWTAWWVVGVNVLQQFIVLLSCAVSFRKHLWLTILWHPPLGFWVVGFHRATSILAFASSHYRFWTDVTLTCWWPTLLLHCNVTCAHRNPCDVLAWGPIN